MIAIVDYGVGNLRSVYKSFEAVAGPLGIQVDIVDHPVDFTQWSALVLPGQGAFGDSINNLRPPGIRNAPVGKRRRRPSPPGHLCRHADAL